MTHIKYTRTDYDPSTKTLILETTSHKSKPDHPRKAWEVDPQRQIIDLLAQQTRLLIDLKAIMANQLKRTAPYHTGPQQVSIAPVSKPVVQDPPPPSDEGSV